MTIFIVVLLVPINWSLEVWKWKILTNPIKSISWTLAWLTVARGLVMNWIIPFTIGDFLGRLIDSEDKLRTSAAIALSRAGSLIATASFGLLGLFSFLEGQFDIGYARDIAILYVMGGVVIVFITFFLVRRFLAYHSTGVILRVVGLSFLRYCIFAFQFSLLLHMFNPGMDMNTILNGVTWIFLVRSAIPGLFGSIGIREASALLFFENIVSSPILILIPSLIIWVANLALPSLLGLGMIHFLKTDRAT